MAALLLGLTLTTPALARDGLGMFGGWGAFRDPGVQPDGPRCYAIAKAEPSLRRREFQPYADIATWPRRQLRAQVHFRLSRRIAVSSRIMLDLDGQRFELAGGGADAWTADRRMDAAVAAAMRSAQSMTVSAKDARNRRFADTYVLAGAATAMDAAAIGCSRLR